MRYYQTSMLVRALTADDLWRILTLPADEQFNQEDASELLEKAAADRNWDAVEALLIRGVKPRNNFENDGNLLHLAAQCEGTSSVIARLIALMNKDQVDKVGKTAILIAAENGKWGLVRLFLDAKASINNNLCMALVEQVTRSRSEVVQWSVFLSLIAEDKRQKTAIDFADVLRIALTNKNWDFISKLLNSHAKLDYTRGYHYFDRWFLNEAMRDHKYELIKLFIDRLSGPGKREALNLVLVDFMSVRYDQNYQRRITPLISPEDEAQCKDFIGWLLKSGAEINYMGGSAYYVEYGTALYRAISLKSESLVNYLIMIGAEVKKIYYDKTQPEGIRLLIKQALHVAALKTECESYLTWLKKKYVKKPKEADILVRIRLVEDLIGSVTTQSGLIVDNAKLLQNFSDIFHDEAVKREFHKDQSEPNKKWKRIIFAILTAGIYAVHRSDKLGSSSFWKSRRGVFADKAEKHSKAPVKRS